MNVEHEKIEYLNNQEIYIEGKQLETLLARQNTSKKKVFLDAESRVLNYLSTFNCAKNHDVSNFLNDENKCIRMQKESTSRTYLIIDSEDDNLAIAAYFAIAFKPITLEKSHGLSKNKVRKLPISKNNHRDLEIISTILIGQIGRNDSYSSAEINLKDILDYVFGVINIVKEYIGGNVVLIEVDNEPKLVSHYEKYGFEKIQDNDNLCQLMQFVNYY
ncbi:MAG: hypothetical protein PHU33_13735 [Bacteroidales bacterium]|nr:hypothetical protein [Bacteroidales bacterium]